MCVVYVHVYVHTSTCEHVKEEDYVHMSVLCAHTCMGQELHSQNQSRVEEREREGRLTNSINKLPTKAIANPTISISGRASPSLLHKATSCNP